MMKKFFISSTFKDMHYERDILHERVFPEINSYAMQYGEKVAICDLRWGVNTEDMDNDSSARKVLSVCMDAIDSSSYMIVLLGQRYGWIPSRDVVQMAAERGGLDLDSLEKSITALEIEYGALKCPENAEKVFFYFRENIGQWPVEYGEQDSESAHKLCQLKERIRSLSCGHIRTIIGGDIQMICHLTHLFFQNQKIFCFGAHHHICCNAMFLNPFHLRIYWRSTNAAGHK